jgi:hypothetical protein
VSLHAAYVLYGLSQAIAALARGVQLADQIHEAALWSTTPAEGHSAETQGQVACEQ